MTLVYDATDLKVGRLATAVAKAALKGESVEIVNAEKAVITGSREHIVSKYLSQYARGRKTKGPFQPRMPDRFVRRIIRGMLPTDTIRGREAFRRVMVFIGNPKQKEAQTLLEASIANTPGASYLTVKDVCALIGGRQ